MTRAVVPSVSQMSVPTTDVDPNLVFRAIAMVDASTHGSAAERGQALRNIHDWRLYRETHATFEVYCRGRWNIGKSYAYGLINCAVVADKLNGLERQPIPPWEPATTDEQREARLDDLAGLEATIARVIGRCPTGDDSRLPASVRMLPPPRERRAARKNTDASPTDVYRFYDRDNRLLYVGVSVSLIHRLTAHREREWWPQVARIDVTHQRTRAEALWREAMLIETLRPPYNIAGKPEGRRR